MAGLCLKVLLNSCWCSTTGFCVQPTLLSAWKKGNQLGDWPCTFSKSKNKDPILNLAPEAPGTGQLCMKTLKEAKSTVSVLQSYVQLGQGGKENMGEVSNEERVRKRPECTWCMMPGGRCHGSPGTGQGFHVRIRGGHSLELSLATQKQTDAGKSSLMLPFSFLQCQ